MNKMSKLVLEFLEDFKRLERKDTDEIGWIALKFSASRKEAEGMIRAAKGEST